MSFITKFPLKISDDGRAETTDNPQAQFDLFTNVRPFTLVRDPEYGIDARVLMQNPIANANELLSIYLITFREKVAQYFTNITITRAVASFDADQRMIFITIFSQREGQESQFKFSVKIK